MRAYTEQQEELSRENKMEFLKHGKPSQRFKAHNGDEQATGEIEEEMEQESDERSMVVIEQQ
jgi:hypothetical protein